MIAARDARAQLGEVRHIAALFYEFGIQSTREGLEQLSRDDRQTLIVWLDDFMERGNRRAPLGVWRGLVAREGETWKESLFCSIYRGGWQQVDKAQRRPFPNEVKRAVIERAPRGDTGWIERNVERVVTVDGVLLERKAARVRQFHVCASGWWMVEGRQIQKTNVERSLASFVMGFERV